MTELNSSLLTINGVRNQGTIFKLNSGFYSKLDTSLSTLSYTISPAIQPITEFKLVDDSNEVHQIATRLSCNNCNIEEFDSFMDQKEHFKSELHRLNLSRKTKGLPILDDKIFEEQADDICSISGSESDIDDDLVPNSDYNLQEQDGARVIRTKYQKKADQGIHSIINGPVAWYKVKDTTSEFIGFYKSIFPLNNVPDNGLSLENEMGKVESSLWILIMVGGGHFAAGVFDNNKGRSKKNCQGQSHTLIASKTFHRYTVRRKQGKSQFSKDSGGGACRSVGAIIRRQMQSKFKAEIKDLLESWSKYLDKAVRIFVRAPSNNYRILYKHNNPPIDHKDVRVTKFPFSTRRPNLKEIQNAYTQLINPISASLTEEYYNSKQGASISSQQMEMKPFTSLLGKETRSKLKNKDKAKAKSKSDDSKKKDNIEQGCTNPTNPDLIQQSKEIDEGVIQPPSEFENLEVVRNWLEKNTPTQPEYNINPFLKLLDSVPYLKTHPNHRLRSGPNSPTLLHLASLYNHSSLIPIFLELGCDPNLAFGKDEAKPFQLASTKSVKTQFRLYRYNHPTKYVWDEAHVSAALSPEELEKKSNANKAKQKAKKQNQKTKTSIKPIPKPTPKTTASSKNKVSKLEFGTLGSSSKLQALKQPSSLGYSFGAQNKASAFKHLGVGNKLGGSSPTPLLSDREARLKAIEDRLNKN